MADNAAEGFKGLPVPELIGGPLVAAADAARMPGLPAEENVHVEFQMDVSTAELDKREGD